MNYENKLNAVLALVEELRADIVKVDKGQLGAPGTRTRKNANLVIGQIQEIRKGILSDRKENAEA